MTDLTSIFHIILAHSILNLSSQASLVFKRTQGSNICSYKDALCKKSQNIQTTIGIFAGKLDEIIVGFTSFAVSVSLSTGVVVMVGHGYPIADW